MLWGGRYMLRMDRHKTVSPFANFVCLRAFTRFISMIVHVYLCACTKTRYTLLIEFFKLRILRIETSDAHSVKDSLIIQKTSTSLSLAYVLKIQVLGIHIYEVAPGISTPFISWIACSSKPGWEYTMTGYNINWIAVRREVEWITIKGEPDRDLIIEIVIWLVKSFTKASRVYKQLNLIQVIQIWLHSLYILHLQLLLLYW